MAHIDKRDLFIRKWFDRALSDQDVFDKFYGLWITLVVAADKKATHLRRTDAERIQSYFILNKDKILFVMNQQRELIERLCRRVGTQFGNLILDIGNPYLRDKIRLFVNHYSNNGEISDTEKVDILSIIINRIRNNTFHGRKVYDDEEDINLLSIINPIIESILVECELFLQKEVL